MTEIKQPISENSSVSECICEQYNKLLNYNNFSNVEEYGEYLKVLKHLNFMLSTKIIDTRKANHEFYYYVGLANYIVHDYNMARYYFEKSILLESCSTLVNKVLGFKKRLRLCYCYEYGNLVHGCNNFSRNVASLKHAIKLLIGENPNFFEALSSSIVEKISELRDISSYKEMLNAIWIDRESDSLYKYVYSNELQNNDEYIKEIAHILSHCLSEYFKHSENAKPFYSLRVAERLMKFLGDSYITCYATILAENKDYVSAFKEMSRVRDDFQASLIELKNVSADQNTIEYYKREIAQINYYGWYFSFLSNFGNETQWKEAFKSYCDETRDDYAKVYYELLNIKEVYQKAFSALKSGLGGDLSKIDETAQKVEEAFESFSRITLSPSFFKEIQDEWVLQQSLYKVFMCCYAIVSKKDYGYILNSISNLIEEYSGQVQVNKNLRMKDKEENLFYELSFGNAKLLFYGPLDLLNEFFASAVFATEIVVTDFSIEGKFSVHIAPPNISNCLFYITDANRDKVLKLLKDIKSHNLHTLPDWANYKNVFICNLGHDDNSLDEYKEEEGFIFVTDRTDCAWLSHLFAVLENGIYGTYKELSSFVIAPVDNTQTIEWQNDNKLKEFTADQIGVENCALSLRECLKPCFVDEKCLHSRPLRKKLNLPSDLTKDLYKAIVFEGLYDKRGKVYMFDVENSMFYADPIEIHSGIYLKTSDTGDDPVLNDITLTFISFNANDNKGKKHSDCEHGVCYSQFNFVELQDFVGLGQYLFALIGISWLGKKYVMINMPSNGENEKKKWALLIFNQEPAPSLTKSLCQVCQQEGGIIVTADTDNLGIKSKELISMTSIQEMSKSLIPVDTTKKYVFVSYRRSGDKYDLCYPVYYDAGRHWNLGLNGEKLNYAIDCSSVGGNFDNDIENLLNNPNCIGAIIYLSKEYFTDIRPAGEDRCLKEIQLINQRHGKDKNFFKICLFLETKPNVVLDNEDNPINYLKYIKKTLFRYNGAHDDESRPADIRSYYKQDRERYRAFRELFGCQLDDATDNDIHIAIALWEKDMDLFSIGNFRKNLSDAGIISVSSNII